MKHSRHKTLPAMFGYPISGILAEIECDSDIQIWRRQSVLMPGKLNLQAISFRGTARQGVLAFLTAMMACAVVPLTASAQAPPPGVFSEVGTAVAPLIGPALEPATLRSRVVRIDTQKITAARRGREVLKLNLFQDAVVEVDIRRVRPTRTGYFISGKPKGFEWGDVRLVVNGPVMVGTVIAPEGEFRIRSASSGRHVIRQIDPSAAPFECEVDEASAPAFGRSPANLPAISSIGATAPGAMPPALQAEDLPTEDGSEVRVLVVFTPAMQRTQGGAAGMRALIDLFIESANQAFEDSGINPRLVLAHSAMVDYVETGSDLVPLISRDDGRMDEVHSLRNEHAADLVHLLTDKAIGPAGSAVRPFSESLTHEANGAFAVTANSSEETFTHEIGHNFGLRHDRHVNSFHPSSTIYSYAFGYVNQSALQPGAPVSARWRTVMAYPNACSDAGFGCPRLLRFSNPDQTHLGDDMGVSASSQASGPEGPADARRAINSSARWVGSFRSEACTEFSVSHETSLAPLAGGEIVVRVNAPIGCVWEASSQADFMTIASDRRQSGSGIVNVKVDANQTGAEQTGVLAVAGKNITVRQMAKSGGVCNRSPAVIQAITAAAGFGDPAQCDQVTEDQLAHIYALDLSSKGLSILKVGDFAGLRGLVDLNASRNQLTELPAGLLAGLSNLRFVKFDQNQLTKLPEDLFASLSKLERLHLEFNRLENLPASLFSDLASLTMLRLSSNRITTVHGSLLAGLAALESLELDYNAITELPPGLLDGFPALRELELQSNSLRGLPSGLFAELSSLEYVDVSFNHLLSLPGGLFTGLSGLQHLNLSHNRLSGLPEGLFSDLSVLGNLQLQANRIAALRNDSFAGLSSLRALRLDWNRLAALPGGLFTDLEGLEELNLSANEIGELPAGLFSGLSGLHRLRLVNNRLRSLPPGIFSRLHSLRHLSLYANELAEAPEGVFSGLAALEELDLGGNRIDPLPLRLSVEPAGENRFKVVVPSAAPFALQVSVSIAGGTIEEGASDIGIPAGETESGPLAVARESGSYDPVSVDLGVLPGLPSGHSGYALVKSDSLPLRILPSKLPTDATLTGISLGAGELDPAFSPDNKRYEVLVENNVAELAVGVTLSNARASLAFLDSEGQALEDVDKTASGHQIELSVGGNTIRLKVESEDATSAETYELAVTRDGPADGCVRSSAVRDAILAEIPEADGCADLTAEHLVSILRLDLSTQQISALIKKDFAGLKSLEELDLSNNDLTTLPSGIFSDLKKLRILELNRNELSNLPEGVFSGLTFLNTLRMSRNRLVELPSGVFSDLAALRHLSASSNRLGSLRVNAFTGLTALRSLYLHGNRLIDLPAGVFSDLTNLEQLGLWENSLLTLRPDMFYGLAGLKELILGDNDLTEIPPGLFDGLPDLEELSLDGSQFASLPEGIFAGLRKLRYLGLSDNELSHLPAGLFAGLNALESLNLWGNDIGNLPADLFSGLTSLRRLFLNENRLSRLPSGIFSGLTALDKLDLRFNSLALLPITVSLEKVGESQFRATAHTAAPFDLQIPLHISDSGQLEEGASTVNIPAGDSASMPVAVTRSPGSEDAVVVNLGILPDLPEKHVGYALTPDDTLPRTILPGPKAPPSAQVTGLEVTAGVAQLEVTWVAVEDADGYKVQWKSGGQDYNEERQAEVEESGAPSHTITGLEAGTEYTVRVIATKENAADGLPSDEATGTPAPTPAMQVRGVAVTPGVEELVVAWTAIEDADGYKVQWKSGSQDYAEVRQAEVSGGQVTSHTITGLQPGTEYTARVIATLEIGDDGEPSEEVISIPKAESAAQVTGIAVEPGLDEFRVSWDAVADADGYKVEWKSGTEDYDEERQVVLLGGQTTSYTIIDLAADTEYTIRVIATREHAGDGLPSEEFKATLVSASPDINADGKLDGDDALIMYHSYAAPGQLGDGETGGTAQSRQSLLAGYSGKVNPSDDELKEMIRKANAWREVGVYAGGDINEDGELDESDVFVMYCAYALENLVGNGETDGTARFRSQLLSPFAGKANPTDEDLKKMLRRANKLREDFG